MSEAAPTLDKPVATGRVVASASMWLLLVIYILNFLDRQVVNILAEPIKQDLGLDDRQLGMLTGLSFALFYTVLGIPIARLAERANRVWIISGATALWSLFTVASGFAANFTQLLLARVGVGVGEAGCSPPAHSLITDYAPREQRASALAFYSLGIPLGSLLGLALGGLVADAYGWRTAFFVAGAPGLLVAAVALVVLKEPRRAAPATAARVETPSLGQALKELATKPSFWLISVGASLGAFVSYGQIAFFGSFYARNHGTELAGLASGFGLGVAGFLGTTLGLIIGISGGLGTFAGGRLADAWTRRNRGAYADTSALGVALAFPLAAAAFLVPSGVASLALLAIPVFLNNAWYGPVFASVQSLAQPRTRATAAAIMLFIVNLIGLGLGPLVLGDISTRLTPEFGEAQAVRWAMIATGAAGLIGGLLFWLAGRRLGREMVG